MKTCSKCKVPKEPKDFSKDRQRPDGLHGSCKACQRHHSISYLAKNPEAHKRVGEDGLTSRQRQVVKNPNLVRDYGLARRYGLTPESYERLLNEQGNACGICGETNQEWHVDHDHITGKIRSILCRRCNLAIGFLKDSAKLAAAATTYLTKHGSP